MSTELTEPTTESAQLSKTLAEMQGLDETEVDDSAEVCIPWRSDSTATPIPLCSCNSGMLSACGYGFQAVASR